MPARSPARRVLYVQPAVAVGGAERQASILLPRLHRFGWEATAAAGPGREIFTWFAERGLRRALYSRHFPSGEPLSLWRWPELLRDALALSDELDALHRRQPFDVVIGSLGFGWGIAGLLGRRWQIPSIWRAGGLSLGATDDYDSPEAQALRLMTQLLGPSALICNARAVAAWWRPLFELPTYVVPNGVELPERHGVRTRRESDPLVVGFLGRLAIEKNLGLLVDALARARRQGTDVRGLFAGPGDATELRHHITRLGLDGSIRVVNRALEAEALYDAVDVLALPSRAEGCPNVLLEAMAHGLPVVATAVGGIPEIVDDGRTGLLVAPGAVEELAAALRLLATRPALGAHLGTNARRHAERFTPDASAAVLARVLDRVTGTRSLDLLHAGSERQAATAVPSTSA